MTRTKTTRICTITLEDGGWLRVENQKGATMHLLDAQDAMRAIAEFTDGQKIPILVDLRFVKGADGDARAYFAGEEASKILLATAFLVDSPVSRVIGNFFIGLNKPQYPVKLFSSDEQAIEWLKEIARCE